jgi:Putative Ig domain/HYDIN/CFA65/VesB-like, Ig-like domain/IPT/TIG domain/Domain of unknown function (DUF5122) beta-propeller
MKGEIKMAFHAIGERKMTARNRNGAECYPTKHIRLPVNVMVLLGKRVRAAKPMALLVVVVLLVLCLQLVIPALSQKANAEVSNIPNENTWIPNGDVRAVVKTIDTTYIGGYFSYIGQYSGHAVSIDAGTGEIGTPYLKVNDNVWVCASDGSGGYYIGGDFTMVGNSVRNRIAHILSDGTTDPSWNPDANGRVTSLAVSDSTVYVGGEFSSIGGQARKRLAAIDSSGTATSWNPNPYLSDYNDARIFALTIYGSTVYVGGSFTKVGGQTRKNLAALDAISGTATGWNPNPDGSVMAIAASGSTVYVAGTFGVISGYSHRKYFAALDASTGGCIYTFNPYGQETAQVGWDVDTIVVSGSTIYVGGCFGWMGNTTRHRIAALDQSGQATAWNPDANGRVTSIAVSGSTVYAVGSFTTIGGQSRKYTAALDVASGTATSWNPNIGGTGYLDPNYSGPIRAIAYYGSAVFVGGDFRVVNGVERQNAAALDSNGIPTSWNPSPNSEVWTLAVSGSTVYAGGSFTNIGGQARKFLAALDATSGNATSWQADANNTVSTLTISGSTVYAGGDFTNIGGQSRNHIAALDVSGSPTPWNPNADRSVQSLAVSGSIIYAGGGFYNIGGQQRFGIAALDIVTGNASSWNPNPSYWGGPGSICTIAVSGSTVYVGGAFTSVGGQPRNNIAALDAFSGNSTSWNPNANDIVRCLSVSGTTIFAGGWFTQIGGQARQHVAELNPSGKAMSWNPNVPYVVESVAAYDNAVHVEGIQYDFIPATKPHITSLSRTSAPPGATITIEGTDFGLDPGTDPDSYVCFGTFAPSESDYLSWSDSSIEVKVPSDANYQEADVVVHTLAGDSNSVTFNVVSDSPPVLEPIGNQSVDEGQELKLTISATDPDNDALTFSASELPDGASFDPDAKTFSWTPDYTQAGTYTGVHFEVSDGTLTESEDITITVNSVNHIVVSPLSANYGDVERWHSKTQIVKLTNGGDTDLTVSSIVLTPESNAAFTITKTPSTPAVLAAGTSADVEVTFRPTTTGSYSATLSITSDDKYNQVASVPLDGNCIFKATPAEQIADIMAFFNDSVKGGTLTGTLPGILGTMQLSAFRNMLQTAGFLINAGRNNLARLTLLIAYYAADGKPLPPDLAKGPAAQELADRIQALINTL